MRIQLFIVLTFVFLISKSNIGLSQNYIPGQIYFDSTGYVEYRAGNLPIILSAPHGGNWEPDSIPDRDCVGCVYEIDAYTRVITWALYDKIYALTGCYPHVVMNRLHRSKFDANRDIVEAADGNPYVEQAWHNYHAFADTAKAKIEQDYNRGLFLDIHGHGHTIQRIELGYLLYSHQLDDPESVINSPAYIEASSIRTLVAENIQSLSHVDLLRGNSSFGTLMDNKGFPCVPSSSDPFADNGEPYFSGGYNTERHGSINDNGSIDAIQIELNQDIRFDSAIRAVLIDSLAHSIIEFIDLHYNNTFIGNYCNITSNTSQAESTTFDFKIYPNPATSYFNLISSQNNITVEIYNYMGQKLVSEYSLGQIIKIDHLPNGYYIILLRQNGNILGSSKLVKKN
jgi:N-formylglutamate amidohydrolase